MWRASATMTEQFAPLELTTLRATAALSKVLRAMFTPTYYPRADSFPHTNVRSVH